MHPRNEAAQNLQYVLQSEKLNGDGHWQIEPSTTEPLLVDGTLLMINSVTSSKTYVLTEKRVIQVMELDGKRQIEWLEKLLLENNIAITNTVRLNPVMYDPDQVGIDKSYQRELEKLASLMKRYNYIDFEIGAHADASGSESYNQQLSQSRANAARDFLITREIQTSRLLAIGYGENAPVSNCQKDPCKKNEASLNRRMEFRLLYLNHHQIVSN